MKPIEQAFLSSILESPDDDAPRLIYADWLEENGQLERAEFIRVQCELAKIDAIEHDCGEDGEWKTTCPACGASCVAEELSRRERELLEEHRKLWTNLVPEYVVDAWSLEEPMLSYNYGARARYHRGFVEEVTLSLADWLQYGPVLVKSAPLRMVRLSDIRLEMSRNGFVWIFPPNSLDLLFRNRGDQLRTIWHKFHWSEADAHAELSRCCLEYAHAKNSKTLSPQGQRQSLR